jgi:alpha-mannosidase
MPVAQMPFAIQQVVRHAKQLPVLAAVCFASVSGAQTAYFADGYHGGIYGHYPDWNTRFMVDTLKQHPSWKINLEIEPETWDRAKTNDPAAYAELQALAADQSAGGRIEFVNPAYAQPYLWNIPGENIIRQFQYGMKKVREHFPGAVFSTYSAEEPCFTSALPGLLTSLGYRNAVLKNPDTCWGGYTRAFGGELINWVGPDGTALPTVPRYGVEALQPRSTWQTTAWNNSPAYLQAAREAGIQHPVGMCLQDAGWKNGPWLGDPAARQSEYVTWRGYFQNIANQKPAQDWRFSQEDVQVSLVWGAQVLQRLAQQVRAAEMQVIQAEKMATLAHFYAGTPYPNQPLEDCWRNVMLSEHHDCWIVPYNGRMGDTWADKVARWTGTAQKTSAEILQQSMRALTREDKPGNFVGARVFNTMGVNRRDVVNLSLPAGWQGPSARVLDDQGHEMTCQVVTRKESGGKEVVFQAEVPSLGYRTYQIQPAAAKAGVSGAKAREQKDGTILIETDLYQIVIDPAKGGVIRSLQSRQTRKEFVDGKHPRAFNEIRGHFYADGQFRSQTDTAAHVAIIEPGPVRVVVEVTGKVGEHNFTETLAVAQGQRRIDVHLRLDWVGNPGVGSAFGQKERWRQEENQRAFYDNRDKLMVQFPTDLKGQRVYKNAPFDVTESQLTNTFFTTWDGIKNNVILQWMDVTDATGEHGLALLTDHTTSCAHGADHPPGLILQYSGIGLWGRRYGIAGPTAVRYALIPHSGRWDRAGIATKNAGWNEPLLATLVNTRPAKEETGKSMLDLTGTGWEVTALTTEGKSLLIRLFNAEGDGSPKPLRLDGRGGKVDLVELNGALRNHLPTVAAADGKTVIQLAIPRFGIRTLKFDGLSPNASRTEVSH